MTYNESRSPIRVALIPNFGLDGISITIGLNQGPGESTSILRISEDGRQHFETVEPFVIVENPTMRLSDEFARALLEELLRYYQGASDMHTVRSDFLHERGRVDDMIKTLSEIVRDAT